MSDKVAGVVSIDGNRIGVVKEMKTDSRSGVVTIEVFSVPKDVQLMTPKEAFDKGLLNEHDYRKMEAERNKVQTEISKEASNKLLNGVVT